MKPTWLPRSDSSLGMSSARPFRRVPSIWLTQPASSTSSTFLQSLPGVRIPPEIIERLDGLSAAAFADESLRIAAETLRAVAELPGVAGVHILAPYWEQQIPTLLVTAGLAGRTRRA